MPSKKRNSGSNQEGKKLSLKDLSEWAEQNNIQIESSSYEQQYGRTIDRKDMRLTVPRNEPPMMYRAQIQGRCDLQFGGESHDRRQWLRQWIRPYSLDYKPSYQYKYETLDSEDYNNTFHSTEIQFPYRVFSNSGQDSILRPVITVHGIPFIPGSSIKGLFKRLIQKKSKDCQDIEIISKYCGTQEIPGILRFHGAYPIGDWSERMLDIVHPQQSRQLRDSKSTSASALISFYKPKFIFEFSSINSDIDWKNVDKVLNEALTIGLGGKTSTGYGFSSKPNYAEPKNLEKYETALHVSFKGEGVCSTLLNKKPEIRPNMFKASLRGHIMRLLGGVCSSENAVNQSVDLLLGNTDREGIIKLFWESTDEQYFDDTTPISYSTEGVLHISGDSRADSGDIRFIAKVIQFAYVMGGFGKSWRRVWHQEFKPDYTKFAIGCHWQLKSDWNNFSENLNVNSAETLKLFLQDLHQICLSRPGSYSPALIANWREAWHPDRVDVYSKVVNNSISQAAPLFHQEPFKYTLAIGGRERDGQPTSVSSVWHRMLPIGDGKYLEVVTVFRQPLDNWNHRNEGNMRDRFIKQLTDRGFGLVWGN